MHAQAFGCFKDREVFPEAEPNSFCLLLSGESSSLSVHGVYCGVSRRLNDLSIKPGEDHLHLVPIELYSQSASGLAAILAAPRRRCWLDPQGCIQALGDLAIALIALLSSYEQIALPAGAIPLAQQWGVWFIAATLRASPKTLLRCNGFWSLRVSLRPVALDISRRLCWVCISVSPAETWGIDVQSVLKPTIL